MNMPKLVPELMVAARAIVNGKSSAQAAEEIGMSERTMRRKVLLPEFIAYMDLVREENNAALGAATKESLSKLGRDMAEKTVVITKNGVTERLLRIADDPEAKDSDKIMALRTIASLHRMEGAEPSVEGDGAPAKPDIYRAAWMTQ